MKPVNCSTETMEDYTKIHEWELARLHSNALRDEDYAVCEGIQREVNRRIEAGTINKTLMSGFRSFDPKSQKFYGEPNYKGLNGLFSQYQQPLE